jgi:integrase
MPRKSKYPRLRVHVRKGMAGQVWTSYYYDQRHEGKPDTPLGNDYEQALKLWDELHNQKPRIVGTCQEAFDAWEKEVLPEYASEVTRKGYAGSLKFLRPVFNTATWDGITFPVLKAYLKKRTAKTQGNREMALFSVIWRWAYGEGYTQLPWPAAGMERSKWKNKETPRVFEVSDALFAAIYSQAGQTLRDCMDLASATGMRLTDCREVLTPSADTLSVRASKTGKRAEFDVTASPVLSRLVAARRKVNCTSLMLLVTPTGRPVSGRMLRDWWDEAREKAAEAHPELADDLRKMYLRDMRKRAADLAGSLDEASELLQHSSKKVTETHYRTKPTRVRPVR